ncbi:hypothetical protein PIIN_03313 [Serendipita indica DSM 11827]|uniref:Uncharacterized protein n=1 Tax=Serendipita indica (strain DSM 11827) TaxID=1109443 RepID=G4TDM9_SERID|nr:hypothetical protein PIIN_03313 [Serendipita indica DSM 11827]
MEFIQALDSNFLVLIHAGVAFITSAWVSPTYNLPIFLFGIYAQNYIESHEPLRMFVGFVGVSWLLDLIWLFNNDPATLIKILIILAWMLKMLTFASLLLGLRRRSGGGLPGLGDYTHAETVWNMPTPGGAYTSTGGDRAVDTGNAKPLPTAPSPAPAPPVPTMPHVPPAQPIVHHQQAPAMPAAPAAPVPAGAPPPGTFTI